MAEIWIIHRNQVFDDPIVFRKEVDADAVIADFSKRDAFPWIKRMRTIQETQKDFEAERLAIARESGLAKLTIEEKEALGLET